MTRYDILTDKKPVLPVLEVPVYYPSRIPGGILREEVGLTMTIPPPFTGDLRIEIATIFEAMLNQLMKKADERFTSGWHFENVSFKINASLDTLSARCIFKKAEQNALSSETLGPGEQRAGLPNYLRLDSLRDLWDYPPAIPASATDQART